MKVQGSVLIVVLGLLAILAVVGVTFITMSNLDRSTAINFALQSQFDLAADGAVDYVCHALVQDLWEWDATASVRNYKQTGPRLLTGAGDGLQSNEAFDWPGSEGNKTWDPWLASNLVAPNAIPGDFKFSFPHANTPAGTRLFYGIRFNAPGTDDPQPYNVGIAQNPSPALRDGYWIPELSHPYEFGIIRASVTVQDHGALVNLNAHGNKISGSGWNLEGNVGKGYFISDVDPTAGGLMSLDLRELLLGGGGVRPGRWAAPGSGQVPGLPNLGEALLENPKDGRDGPDGPLTLDEEFELRKLTGTYVRSRLEWLWPQLLAEPGPGTWNPTAVLCRLNYTTVGWTAEVTGDGKGSAYFTGSILGVSVPWSRPKADVNLESDTALRNVLSDVRAFSDASGARLGQFVANLCAFREISPNNVFKKYGDYIGARRQPLFTEVRATITQPPADPTKDPTVWKVEAELANPWPGDNAGETGGLTVSNLRVIFDLTPLVTVTLSGKIPDKGVYPVPQLTRSISVPAQQELKDVLKAIRLEVTTPQVKVLDILSQTEITRIQSQGGIRRPVAATTEDRGGGEALTVLYVRDWAGGAASMGTVNWSEVGDSNRVVPIRFPHSVPDPSVAGTIRPALPLPPRDTGNRKFKAIPRLGDLNQVLCPTDANAASFWPWIGRASQASDDTTLKFDWKDQALANNTAVSLANAANGLCVSSPWNDDIDNDGDLKKDAADLGKVDSSGDLGRFGGPEVRVAGRININTASETTLRALARGLTIPDSIVADIMNYRKTRPFRSPAEILQIPTIAGLMASDAEALGFAEKRDLAWTRLSNIITVRSDTFSIYGTVQYVETPLQMGGKPRLLKNRRFWALVDRSPSLAFLPPVGRAGGTANRDFIHPRVMNFQWLE